MNKIKRYINFERGIPQFRIDEFMNKYAPFNRLYSQMNLIGDLTGIKSSKEEPKKSEQRMKCM